MNKSRELAILQKRRFSRAEKKRFLWQTENPYIRVMEQKLLAPLAKEKADRILEVGCGEGANITNLRALGCKTKFIGVDFSMEKVAFCRSQNLDNCLFLCADGINLPFRDGLFDLVSCRDLLHHVNHNRTKAISEMIRVCKRNAKIEIIESNGKKLTLALFAVLFPAERGMIGCTPEKIKRIIKGFEDIVNLEGFFMLEPSNLFRVLLHYEFGFPFLANFKWFRKFLDFVNVTCKKVMPENKWAYSVTVLRKQRPFRE